MTEWHKVGEKRPDHNSKIEVIGYYTFCWGIGPEREISVRNCIYDQLNEVYHGEGGYMILPLIWRYIE